MSNNVKILLKGGGSIFIKGSLKDALDLYDEWDRNGREEKYGFHYKRSAHPNKKGFVLVSEIAGFEEA